MNCKLFLFLLGVLCITGRVRAKVISITIDDAKKALKAAQGAKPDSSAKVPLGNGKEVAVTCKSSECSLPPIFAMPKSQVPQFKGYCLEQLAGGTFQVTEKSDGLSEAQCSAAGFIFKLEVYTPDRLDIRLLRTLLALLVK